MVTIGELSTEIPLSSLQSTPSFDFKPLPLFLPLNFAPGGPDATLRWFVQKRRARAWCSPRQHVKKMEKGASVSLRRHPQNGDMSTYSLPTLVQHKQGALERTVLANLWAIGPYCTTLPPVTPSTLPPKQNMHGGCPKSHALCPIFELDALGGTSMLLFMASGIWAG